VLGGSKDWPLSDRGRSALSFPKLERAEIAHSFDDAWKYFFGYSNAAVSETTRYFRAPLNEFSSRDWPKTTTLGSGQPSPSNSIDKHIPHPSTLAENKRVPGHGFQRLWHGTCL
jgi:hypothetical protein